MPELILFRSYASLLRATAEELLKEYKACESPEYITYVRAFITLLLQVHAMRFVCTATETHPGF